MKPTNSLRIFSIATGVALFCCAITVTANESPAKAANNKHDKDPHYTAAGFFDIHVCNWPDRELFFMPLFSTTRYSEITSVEVHYPNSETLTPLNLEKFMVLKPKGKPEKHVFMTQMDVPNGAADGWYSATINLADGTQIIAKDYVIVSHLPRPSGMNPADGTEEISIPEKLTWSSVGDGSYYQVFIRDKWNDGELIFRSKLLKKPELKLPSGLLQPDGLYSWQIHARDTNEDVLLGDFNTGSMSQIATFSTSAD